MVVVAKEGVKVGEKEATDHDRGSTTVKHSGKMTVKTGLDTKEGLDTLGNLFLHYNLFDKYDFVPTIRSRGVPRGRC